MPINASIEFEEARKKYDQAETPSEKLAALQEMRSTAPSHKGAEKLRAEISLKISKLKKEMEKQAKIAKKSSGPSLNIKKEGDGQVAVMGAPNTGKSHLLKSLTGADVEVAPYPFTTTHPEIGVMDYKGAKVQLVEIPAIIEGSSKGKANGTQLLSLARNADAIIIMHTNEKERELVVNELKKARIIVNRKKPRIEIKQSAFKGITLGGKQFLKMSEKEFERALKSFGIHNASILLEEETTFEKLAEALDNSLEYKNCLFIDSTKKYEEQKLKKEIFDLLERIIVYTKKPGEEADLEDPLVMDEGTTAQEAAEKVHKDIAKKLKYVKVWGSTKFPGQRVAKEYKLKSGDIIEIS